MTTRERVRTSPDPNPTPTTAPSTRSTTSVVQPARRLPGERPDGQEWPDAYNSNDLRDRWMRERARREHVIHSIRCHLAEQPNPRAARLAERRWINDIRYIADSVIAVMNSTETEE